MANSIKHQGPAQQHVVDKDVILLRKVDFKRLGVNVVDMLRSTDLRPGEKEGDRPWFLEGYVSNDQPRDYQMSVALMKNTLGFALARTDTGEILHEFERNQLERASKIADRAKAELAVEILLAEAVAEDEAPATDD